MLRSDVVVMTGRVEVLKYTHFFKVVKKGLPLGFRNACALCIPTFPI